MYVVVEHEIDDPAAFWSRAEEALPGLPAGTQLRQSYPNPDGSRCVCIWEANSLEDVRGFVETNVGSLSRNDYYPLDTQKAVGFSR